MPSTFRAELRESFDVGEGDDAQKYFDNLSADPTNEAGTAVVATTSTGVVTVPLSNVIGIVETS